VIAPSWPADFINNIGFIDGVQYHLNQPKRESELNKGPHQLRAEMPVNVSGELPRQRLALLRPSTPGQRLWATRQGVP